MDFLLQISNPEIKSFPYWGKYHWFVLKVPQLQMTRFTCYWQGKNFIAERAQ